MSSFFLKLYLVVLAFATSLFLAQNIDKNTEATLMVNNQPEKVQLFSTTELLLFNEVAQNSPEKPLVVLLNKENLDPAQFQNTFFILTNFEKNGFQFFNKSFEMIELPITDEKFANCQYIIKTKNPINKNDKLSLETDFSIWNPATSIKIGPINLHFYSLMFVLAFGIGYFLMSTMFRIDKVDMKYLEPLFTWTLVGTIFGARLGHVIFYQPELFKEDFWSVFLPISTKNGIKFTGFSGLASHGATIALIGTTLYYSFKIIKKNPFWVYDRLGIVVAIGGAFVRFGNFFNSEIIGKPAFGSPFAVFFPQQSAEYGLTVPRYPTQLFEAFGYISLFIILWLFYRYTDKKKLQGWLFGLFFILLWAIRFFVEFLKEPQGNEFISFAGLNTGQVLSIPFMLAGFAIMIYSKRNRISE